MRKKVKRFLSLCFAMMFPVNAMAGTDASENHVFTASSNTLYTYIDTQVNLDPGEWGAYSGDSAKTYTSDWTEDENAGKPTTTGTPGVFNSGAYRSLDKYNTNSGNATLFYDEEGKGKDVTTDDKWYLAPDVENKSSSSEVKTYNAPSFSPMTGHVFLGWKYSSDERSGDSAAHKDIDESTGKTAESPEYVTLPQDGVIQKDYKLTADWYTYRYKVTYNNGLNAAAKAFSPLLRLAANAGIKRAAGQIVTGTQDDQEFRYDVSDVLEPVNYKRDGYVFTGWTAKDGTIHQPGEVVRNWSKITDEEGKSSAVDNAVFTLTANWMAGKDATGESAKDAQHSHVWVDNYDEHYHWKECSICGTIQSGSKQAHTLQTTGSCYRMNDNGGAAMRQVCTACGYKSKPLYAILGKWENYSNYYAKNGFASSNYYDGPGNLNNVQQISYSEFRSRYGSYKFFSGQPCTWADPDGDGFGWVFGGGFVITRSKAERNNGMRSTLDLILGSANTHPAPNCEDEFPEVYRILRDGRDSGKSKFLDNLTYKESTNARSYLYGIREKYQDISSSQWKQIVSMLAGYTAHKSGWGWSSEDLIHPSAMNSGNTFYGHSDYDSSKDRGADFSNGISTHCDVCGADYDGYEAIRRNWYICSYPTDYAKTLKDGKVHECGGHTVYGKGWTPIATIYDSYQMSGNNIVEVSRRVVTLQDGVSWSLDTSDDTTLNRYIIGSHNVRDWTYPYDSTFTYDGVTTNQACGYYYPNSDITNPSSISVSDVPSKTANVNGVTWVISTKMTVSGYDGVDLSNAYESIKHIVHISLSDGSKTLYEGDAQCNSSNYFSLTFTPEMEADSSGKTFTIQVTDPYGNSSSVQKVYRNIDAKLPDILNTEDYTGQWSTYKTITLKAADTGAGHVKLGINNVSNLQECTLSSDGKTYTRDYTFGGDVYSDDAWAIFAQDAVGNLASKSLHIGLIDNTAPTITNVSMNGKTATVTANDENAELKAKGKAYVGSGIVSYGYLGTNDEAITWIGAGNIIMLPSSGKFYIFAKDRVGNISAKYTVNVA